MPIEDEEVRQALLRMKEKDHRFTLTIGETHYYAWRIFIRGAPHTVSVEMQDYEKGPTKGMLVIHSVLRGTPPREKVEQDIRESIAGELGPD